MRRKGTGLITFFICALCTCFSCSKKTKPVNSEKIEARSENYNQTILLWKEANKDSVDKPDTKKMQISQYRVFYLDSSGMKELLNKVASNKDSLNKTKILLAIPRPDSGFLSFRLYSTTVMDPEMEIKYPLLKTYGGQGIEDRTASVRLDYNLSGFHAAVTSLSGEWIILTSGPAQKKGYYYCFFKENFRTPERKPFEVPDSLR